MSVLRYIFKDRQDTVQDVIGFKIRNDIFEFAIGNAPNLGLNVVEILGIVWHEHLELVLAHSFS